MSTALDSTKFCPTLHRMLSSGEIQLADGEKIPIRATSTINNIRIIRHLLQTEKQRKTLEVGLAYGASALTFLATHQEVHSDQYFRHTAIDPFQMGVWKSVALNLIKSAGFEDNFHFLKEDSALALPSLCREGSDYGLIYVDGSHIFEDVFIDFFYCTRLLLVNGLLLFDDCTDKHVRKVIRFIDTNYSGILKREYVVQSPTLKQQVGHKLGIQQLVAYRKINETPRHHYAKFTSF